MRIGFDNESASMQADRIHQRINEFGVNSQI